MEAIGTLQSIWEGFDFSYLLNILLSVIPALICITLHELSHGLVAYALGDDTAKRAGRLSLNPLKHLDPMGLLMMVVFRFGYAKPVPINMNRFKHPKRGMAVTALAGPLSNFLIAVVFLFLAGLFFFPLRRNAVGEYVWEMILITAEISISLGLFNLIPVPPLDGSKVLFSALSDEGYLRLMRYERYGSLILIALVASGVLGRPLTAAVNAVFNGMLPVFQWGGQLGMLLFSRFAV